MMQWVTIDGSEYEIVAAESSFAADMRAYRLARNDTWRDRILQHPSDGTS